jgi:hypothetical protein
MGGTFCVGSAFITGTVATGSRVRTSKFNPWNPPTVFDSQFPTMDSLTDYAIAKAIVQSGQSDDEWDTLRQGKGSWPEDERKGWKQYRNYSLKELKEEMKIYKQNTGIVPSNPIPSTFMIHMMNDHA